MTDPVVSLKNAAFSYGSTPLFAGLNLSFSGEDMVFVLGENGSGKTTLLKMICGILAPTSGTVSVAGREISSFGRRELASLISFAGDEMPADFPLTVFDFVSLGRFPHRGFFGSLGTEDRSIVEKAMVMMEVSPLRGRYLHELSAGERQRVFLARAVAQDGTLMVLDEPAAHLDMRSTEKIFGILKNLTSQGKTVIVSSHDVNLTARHSKSVLILKGGKLIASGTKRDVITGEKIRDAFDVEVLVDVHPADGTPRVTIIG
ncbi:MAG: ATP-binding cassette domain-containing protein [Deltaproteobacteria bacterium]|nr:ATP-binding cassette domain-containing protein [Deltaproteobacteria bacterium]